MRLTREVRFSLVEQAGPVLNSWGGSPSVPIPVPFVCLRLTVEGPVDPMSGFLCDIRELDDRVRRTAIPWIRDLVLGAPSGPHTRLDWRALYFLLSSQRSPASPLVGMEILLTPTLRLAIYGGHPDMTFLTQSFEFSASHRLYCPGWDEARNVAVFGKCANAHGHGHNYVVDVTVCGEPDAATGSPIALAALERIVKERVIDRLDHKHLNLDCSEFASLNPTVENITQVVWKLLIGQFGSAGLACVRVWETPKTYAEFRG